MRTVYGLSCALLLVCCALVVTPQPTLAQGALRDFGSAMRQAHRKFWVYKEPDSCKECDIECVAKELDWLEHQVELYGSVVPKQPNVWGEARLTRHRHEYEREIYAKLFCAEKAENSLQGAIRRSDQAFLAMALAVENSAGEASSSASSSAAAFLTDGTVPQANFESGTNSRIDLRNFKTDKISLEPTIVADQVSRYLQHLNELRRINEGDDVTDSPGYSLNLVRIPVSVLPGKHTQAGYGAEITFTAEPYLSDQLLPDTFRELIVNDVTDELALPITKMIDCPKNAEGLELFLKFADEVSRARGQLERLQFARNHRNFDEGKAKQEIDSLVNHVARRVREERSNFTDFWNEEPEIRDKVDELLGILESYDINAPAKKAAGKEGGAAAFVGEDVIQSNLPLTKDFGQFSARQQAVLRDIENAVRRAEAKAMASSQRLDVFAKEMVGTEELVSEMLSPLNSLIKKIFADSDFRQSRAPIRTRRSPLPYPGTQIDDIFGSSKHVLGHIALDAHKTMDTLDGHVHLLDVEAFLIDELQAAYEFLAHDNAALLARHCTPELAESIHARRRRLSKEIENGYGKDFGLNDFKYRKIEESIIARHRNEFFKDIKLHYPRAAHTTTASLAWALLVESALLNKRLMEDMVEAAVNKGEMPPIRQGDWLDCYMPHPSPQATEAFKQYVRTRWPIQVFAVDPVTQDQNIADIFQQRREMQFALAIGVANGNVRPLAACRYARRLEKDIETIQLNRTVISFSHGSDTFGWRFYPRFQTPDTPGNVGAFMETLFGGPSLQKDLKGRKLEAGTRECVALVVMPSFVPYVTVESRGNWFGLTNPAKKELTMHHTLKLSRTYQTIREELQCLYQCGCYRPGDVAQMNRALDHLERRLPLQWTQVSVPYENTAGGFELFSNGITDLAPELRGWYGADSVFVDPDCVCRCKSDGSGTLGSCTCDGVSFSGNDKCKENGDGKCAPASALGGQCANTCKGTTLFLVGDGFSVLDTKVVAGGQCVPYVLMSRQIMRVTIPPSARHMKHKRCGEEEDVIDVHVATPYGVTNHLFIPADVKKVAATADELKAVAAGVAALQRSLIRGAVAPSAEFLVRSDLHRKLFSDDVANTLSFEIRHAFVFPPQAGPQKARLAIALRTKKEKTFLSPVRDLLLQGIDLRPTSQASPAIQDKRVVTGKHLLNVLAADIHANLPADALEDDKALELEAIFYLLVDGLMPVPLSGSMPVKIKQADLSQLCPPKHAPCLQPPAEKLPEPPAEGESVVPPPQVEPAPASTEYGPNLRPPNFAPARRRYDLYRLPPVVQRQAMRPFSQIPVPVVTGTQTRRQARRSYR